MRNSSILTLGAAGLLCLAASGCSFTSPNEARLRQYAIVRLTTDIDKLSESEKKMIPLLLEAAYAMDDMFWKQAYGDKHALLIPIEDPSTRSYCEYQYGPWDRLADNEPFIEEVKPKPEGANFYPADMTREEFEQHIEAHPQDAEAFRSPYTIIRRQDDRSLHAIPFSRAYTKEINEAAEKLQAAAELAEDPGLKSYLELRASALLTDEYQGSDMAWMDMKTNRIDVVIGPIETYEDKLFGYKAAAECYVLVKDLEWSEKLARYVEYLPALQRGLPVPDEYKTETPGANADLNAYDVIYYAGDCNAGGKTIAINLPNDEEVQLRKGARRLQLKNAMRAKYDRILVPIVGVLIDPDQRQHVTFDAFFGNVMFHEVAHGLGIKKTVNGKGTVREALKEQSAAVEEGKADILGLYMITALREQGVITEGELMDNYVTFLAGIFRSVRFGAASAHGRANMLRFNFFEKEGAFTRDPASGTYRVDAERMGAAVEELSRRLLVLQGDGDYEAVKAWVDEAVEISPALQEDLDRVSDAGIPVDLVFEQGLWALGLPPRE